METPNTAEVNQNAQTPAPVNLTEVVKKQYWPVSQLEAAQPAIGKVIEAVQSVNGTLTFNFDTEKELPEGYGMAIVPISKKDKESGKMVTMGACIAAIPDYDAVVSDPDGAKFARTAVEDKFIAKVANAVRPRSDGSVASSVPFSLHDFITSNRPEGVYVAYRKLASAYVKLLKKQGLKLMTDSILRMVLESKAFAEAQFPKVPQKSWEGLLDAMIAKARAEGMEPGAMIEWRATRDNAGMPVDEETDLSDLDFSNI